MDENHSPTPTNYSVPDNKNLHNSIAQQKDSRKDRPWLLKGKKNRQRLLLAACVLAALVILGASAAYARINLEFRDYLFYPTLVLLIGSGILAVVGLVVAKAMKEPKEQELDK